MSQISNTASRRIKNMFFRTTERFMSNQTMPTSLIRQLTSQFPIDTSRTHFELYPFSNEERYWHCLYQLKRRYAPQATHEIRVAVLFGESHFLSILPELSQHADLIIFADIEHKLHEHIKHLLRCMRNSTTCEEYLKNYMINNPLENATIDTALSSLALLDRHPTPFDQEEDLSGSPYTTEILKKLLLIKDACFPEFFLNSEVRFNQCKNAVNKFSFAHIQLDLMDRVQCQELAQLLTHYRARITFCNLSNIHDYDNDMERLKVSVPLLLANSPDCLIMYATNSYQANISNVLNDYFDQEDTLLKTEYGVNPNMTKQPLQHHQSSFYPSVYNPFIDNMIIPDDTSQEPQPGMPLNKH